MDPDAALEQLREAIRDWENNDLNAAHRVVEAAQALDHWLSNGGFSPKDWLQ